MFFLDSLPKDVNIRRQARSALHAGFLKLRVEDCLSAETILDFDGSFDQISKVWKGKKSFSGVSETSATSKPSDSPIGFSEEGKRRD